MRRSGLAGLVSLVVLMVGLALVPIGAGASRSSQLTASSASKNRCPAVTADIRAGRVRVGNTLERVGGHTPVRRSGIVYVSLPLLRTALGLRVSWNAHTRRVTLVAGSLRLQTVAGRRTYTLNGRSGRPPASRRRLSVEDPLAPHQAPIRTRWAPYPQSNAARWARCSGAIRYTSGVV